MVKACHWPISRTKLDIIRDANTEDEFISAVTYYTLNGWPKNMYDLPYNLRNLPHSHFSVADGILLYDDRIVIPRTLRSDMLSRIHEGHQGINKCRELANLYIWWPNMSVDIREMCQKCVTCIEKKPAQCKEPLNPSSPPSGPWRL